MKIISQEELKKLLSVDDLYELRKDVEKIRISLSNGKSAAQKNISVLSEIEYLKGELDQILETHTLERSRYYIKRLIKSLSEIKTGKINDLNLNRWKEYDDIITDSLWVLNKRDKSGAHNAGYWGNFIPQIPNQLLRRYTKKNDWALDPFLGSGTTLIECKRLGRNGLGIELQPSVLNLAIKNINNEENPCSVKTETICGDSLSLDYTEELNKLGINSVQFIIMHPPYWDIIKFSDDSNDLSNAESADKFLSMLGKVIDKTYPLLDKGRYFALVIGDKYSNGEWIPLAFYAMQTAIKRGYKLKSIVVKNFEETKGKMKQKELWRYRALVGGFYIFKHEYIFIFKK